MSIAHKPTTSQIISVDDIKSDILTYLKRVAAGETLIITQAGLPMAEIKPIEAQNTLRPYGLCAGDFVVPDDFDAPLPENILQEFEDS